MQLGCRQVVTDGPIQADGEGRFRIKARSIRPAPGPDREDREAGATPAVLEGRVRKDTIDAVVIEDGERYAFQVRLGKEASIVECR